MSQALTSDITKLNELIAQMENKIQALTQIVENQSKIMSVMEHDLFFLGVNFDFQTAIDRHKEIAEKNERYLDELEKYLSTDKGENHG